MNKIVITIIAVLFIPQIVFAGQQQLYKLHLISKENGAACLDGTAPGYYLNQGYGGNQNKFLIVFAGGGFCGGPTLSETLESCYQRSFTGLGSTSRTSPISNGTGHGLLSALQRQNPLFYDWTKIGVLYCDGTEYVGYRENPINYKNKDLYFRGSKNIKQLFNEFDKKLNFYNGEAIVITGVSAGGIAAFEWSNYLVQNTKTSKVYSIPDSGFFITDYYSPIANKKILRQRSSVIFNLVYHKGQMPDPIQSCVQQIGFDLVDCMNSANYAQYLKAPIYMIQSLYDAWSLKNILGVECLTNDKNPYSIITCDEKTREVIEDYRQKSITYLGYIKNNRKDVGIWGPACVQHGFQDVLASYNGDNYKINNTTLMQGIQKFLKNPNNAQWLLDEVPWPENKGCSGQQFNQLNLRTKTFLE